MPDRKKFVSGFFVVFGIVYPAIVFFARGHIHASILVGAAVLALLSRMMMGPSNSAYSRSAFLAAAALLLGLTLIDARLASRSYPVMLSLFAAAAFGVSLFQPASLVEKLALASGEVWSPPLRRYCHAVTCLWTFWLALNAAIAGALAMFGDDEAWALWTGVIFYAVSGMIFAGEWLVRRSPFRQRSGT